MHWDVLAARLAASFATLVVFGGCSVGATPSPSSMPTATPGVVDPPPSASASTFPGPTTAPSPSPASTAPASPTSDPLVGRVVRTLADDGLRVRSRPGLGDDSRKYEPLLPLGTRLYVLDGPVAASGHPWYEVVPLKSRSLPSGWVAGAGEDGEPWITTVDFDCPPVPTDFRSLAALPPGVGLACFPRVPITVDARLIECNCDADGAWYTPSWFFLGSGSPDLLVEPGVTNADSVKPEDWFALNLDPAGEHPDVLPTGKVVRVTGIFDHPAAASCTRTEMDGEPLPSLGCRLEFAVTRLLVSGS